MDNSLQHYMHMAYAQAKIAYDNNETPVGAVILHNAQVIAHAHNRTECDTNALLHAEICVLQQAINILKQKRLPDCDLFVTMEPCTMCAGAIAHARIRTLVFGCYDPKGGAIDHGAKVFTHPTIHHAPHVIGGVMETECANIIQDFFKAKR